MGLRTGIYCERCDEQLSYEDPGFELKEDGKKHNLCGKCVKERMKRQFDEQN